MATHVQLWLLYALAAAAAGALAVPLIVYVGIKLNYKNLRTLYSSIPQDRAFYRAVAWLGGGLFGGMVLTYQIDEFYGVKDPWLGLSMMAAGLIVLWRFVRFLKRHRESAGGVASNFKRPGAVQSNRPSPKPGPTRR